VKKAGQRLRLTEQSNPRSHRFDQRSTLEIVRAINREDKRVATAVARELPKIAQAVDRIVRALTSGGRLIYVGAGTSGRLAALDAAECPPTFGVAPGLVQAVIAGGRRALTSSVEGAEDSCTMGRRDLLTRRITERDAVVGVTASGNTRYVIGALEFARRRGAATIAVTSNPNSNVTRIAAIVIAPRTGPEIIAGSTRMKAGSAQKMVLNMLSTSAMVRLGRVYSNWMVDVALTNAKLRQRGLRILQEATGATSVRAARALREANGKIRVALIMLKAHKTAAAAQRRLRDAGGNLRRALGE
jgi:N-acetylmuramic acid 6-phosphate etherase